MRTKLAKETRLNQSKNDLINALIEKNENNFNYNSVCTSACVGESNGGGGF